MWVLVVSPARLLYGYSPCSIVYVFFAVLSFASLVSFVDVRPPTVFAWGVVLSSLHGNGVLGVSVALLCWRTVVASVDLVSGVVFYCRGFRATPLDSRLGKIITIGVKYF